MKQTKAFTLIEVLAVITLIALLTYLALPLVINQVNKSKGKMDSSMQTLIQQAAGSYIEMNQTENPKKEGNTYCISLKTLIDYGYLKEPLINPSTQEKINIEQYVKAHFISGVEAEYSITNTCEETRR